MGWQERGYRRYFYKSEWINGRVRNCYVGPGILGQRAAEQLAMEQEQRAEARRMERERIEAEEAEHRAVLAISAEVVELAEWTLHALGWHRPNRGPWRKRRMSTTTTIDQAEPTPSPPSSAKPWLRTGGERLAIQYAAHGFGLGADTEEARQLVKDIEAETRTLAKQLASDGADNPIVRTLATMAAVHHTRWSLAITRSTVNRRTLAEEDRFARLAEREGRAFMRTVKLLNAIQKNQPETLQQIFAQFNVGSPDR